MMKRLRITALTLGLVLLPCACASYTTVARNPHSESLEQAIVVCGGGKKSVLAGKILAKFRKLFNGELSADASLRAGVILFEELPESDRLEAYREYRACMERRVPLARRARVVIMDSQYGIYDEQTRKDGETNADDLRRVFKDLSKIELIKEVTSPTWDEMELVRNLNPNLIVIHLSAFEAQTAPTPELNPMFTRFIQYMQSSTASMIVYSRGPQTQQGEAKQRQTRIWKEWRDILKRNKYAGRVDLLLMPRERASFRKKRETRETRNEIKQLAKCHLGLETEESCKLLRKALKERLERI